jgi:hypothetical protein
MRPLILTVAILTAAGLTACKSTGASGTAGGGSTPAASASASAATKAKPHHRKITYVVTGSAADVTYGPSGSDLQGHVPMRVTRKLKHPQYYSISAQLQGSGAVTCKILINGKVIDKARATGSFNIASCEIIQDVFGSKWESANS